MSLTIIVLVQHLFGHKHLAQDLTTHLNQKSLKEK
jgi:hypothetical protein